MGKLRLKNQILLWLRRMPARASEQVVKEATTSPRSHELREDATVRHSPHSFADDFVTITREIGRLRQELARLQYIHSDVLAPTIPTIQWHCNGLLSAVDQFNELVERTDAFWQPQANGIARWDRDGVTYWL